MAEATLGYSVVKRESKNGHSLQQTHLPLGKCVVETVAASPGKAPYVQPTVTLPVQADI
jgi:hypothetical protein